MRSTSILNSHRFSDSAINPYTLYKEQGYLMRTRVALAKVGQKLGGLAARVVGEVDEA